MSYIRCLSNPEALYVWGDGEKTWFAWWDGDIHHPFIGIPSDEIDKFFLELYKWETFDYEWVDLDNPFSYGNMSVVECRIITGKDEFGNDEGTWRIKLILGPDLPDLIMWRVTWEYLKNNFYEHLVGGRIFGVPWYRRWYRRLRGWIREKRTP